MQIIKKRLVIVGLVALCCMPLAHTAEAQCPMCRINVQNSMRTEGGGRGYGLNQGISYLLAIPYLMVGTIAVAVYLGYRKRQRMGGFNQR